MLIHCRRIAQPLAGLAGLIAVASSGHALADTTAAYRCANGETLTATFTMTPGAATLAFSDGRTLKLPQALSADGGRYAEDGTEFWIKGDGATLTQDGKKTVCTTTK